MANTLSGNRNSYDEKGALGASLFLHALLFLVLNSNSDFTLPLGDRTRIDLFWVARNQPAATPARPAAPAAPLAAASPLAPTRPGASRPPRAAAPSPLPPIPTSSRRAEARAPAPQRHLPPAGNPAAAAALPEAGDGIMAAATAPGDDPVKTGTPPASDAGRGREPNPPAAKAPSPSPPRPQPVVATAPLEQTAATPLSEVAPPRTALPEPPEPLPATGDSIAPQQTQKTADAVQPAKESGMPRAQQPANLQTVGTAGKKRSPQPHAAAREERGMVAASLSGDLKLVTAGDSVKISVLFREFPRSRRSRPPSRSEARRLQNITPVCADGPGRTSEAVIEKAHEGVYVFSAEPRGQATAQASFTLKIYDSGSGKKVAELGRRSISQKSVVARVLMPEAILWDDDSAFTGSLQDSESTTKFNSQSGLYWKEYDD